MIYVVQGTCYEELLELLDTLPQTVQMMQLHCLLHLFSVVILGHMIQSLLSNKIYF